MVDLSSKIFTGLVTLKDGLPNPVDLPMNRNQMIGQRISFCTYPIGVNVCSDRVVLQ